VRFGLVRPCDNCPFLKDGGIRLHPHRAREIAQSQVDHQGGSFPCHKTTVETADSDGDLVEGPGTQYCGGALAFAVKLDRYNQLQRIAISLHLFDPKDITRATQDLVFDSVYQMIAAQAPRPIPKGRSPNTGRAVKKRRD